MSAATLDPSSPQAAFAAALLDPAVPCPTGLRAWNGSDPARRFAVHRNNVVSGLIDALAEGFPVVAALVGEDFFRAMAAAHVRACPPRSPVLAEWGEDFAGFIAGFAPAAGLPYLADVARLEQARTRACHAADAEPIDAARLAGALADPDALAALAIAWHPSLQVVASPFAIVSLWSAHQGDGDVPPVVVDEAEQALVLRDGLDVLVLPADPGTAAFVRAASEGAAFGAAAAAAFDRHAGFDLPAALSRLLAHGALVALHPTPCLPGACP